MNADTGAGSNRSPRNSKRLRWRLLHLALFGHRRDDDEGPLFEAKRTCRLFRFGQASELSVPLDWELPEEIVEFEVGRLSAFEDSFDKGW